MNEAVNEEITKNSESNTDSVKKRKNSNKKRSNFKSKYSRNSDQKGSSTFIETDQITSGLNLN